jgi:hypothetical protein
MVSTTRDIPPKMETLPKADIATPSNNSKLNPRSFVCSGTYDTNNCQNLQIRVTYYGSDGSTIITTEVETPTTDGEFWDYTVNAPAGVMSCMIEILCSDDAQMFVTGVQFAPQMNLKSMPAPKAAPQPNAKSLTSDAPAAPVFSGSKTGNSLVLTIKNPQATNSDDSDTVVVIKHLGHNQKTALLPHYHTPHPGAGKRVLTYHNLSSGRYTSKLVYINPADVSVYDSGMIKLP